MVTNTPGVLTGVTADIAMLLLMVARRASEGRAGAARRSWTGRRPTHLLGTEMSGKTLGVLGTG
jgi:lactate dehydrogenase-like 2-hydroxyacid dehydrogenase